MATLVGRLAGSRTRIMYRNGESIIRFLLLFTMLKGIVSTDVETVYVQEKRVMELNSAELVCDSPSYYADNESITWEFQGMPLFYYVDDLDLEAKTTSSSGDKKSRLTISSVTRDYIGVYSCHHRQDHRVHRIYFYLFVEGRENPDCAMSNHHLGNIFWAQEGKEARVLCTLDCPNNVIWIREHDGKIVRENERTSIVPLYKGSVLIIRPVENFDMGNYYCFGGNELFKLPMLKNILFVDGNNYTKKGGGESIDQQFVISPFYLLAFTLGLMILFCALLYCSKCTDESRERRRRANEIYGDGDEESAEWIPMRMLQP